MRIGDLEYTEVIDHVNLATTSLGENVNFSTGPKIRPLLTRAQVTMNLIGVTTLDAGVWLENDQQIGDGSTTVTLMEDQRAFPLYHVRQSISTNGAFVLTTPWETLWWKLLMPRVRVHAIGYASGDEAVTVLHYRWVELTDDEIIEVAAQRSQA